MIAVLDYGIGNLRSAEKALQCVGADAHLVSDPTVADQADAVVLPGVGAFAACAGALRRSGLDEVVRQAVREQKPTLAICVGMQLLFEESEESPAVLGLGILAGAVRRLSPGVRRPQMQWNLVQPTDTRLPGRTPSPEDAALASSSVLGPAPQWFYFVHGYSADPAEQSDIVGTCEYGGTVVAAVARGSLFATQFHPEKSGRAGLGLLSRFAERCRV
ncbi:MAG: imidazole glycerol phosphate synthase subunit HisH [Acidimicrobiales bacterium]